MNPLPSFNNSDRILIIAPHPDDETIGAGGVIQRAVALKIPIHILYLTHGDNNELSFIIYNKRLVFRKNAFLHMGEIRRQEAIFAMKTAGLSENDLTFLGYPDLSTLNIFSHYWQTTQPLKSVFTRVRNVPYKKTLSPNAPYVAESILEDFKKVLTKIKPTKIFVTTTLDNNGEHIVSALMLQIALWDLKKALPPTDIFSYLVHAKNWPNPKGFHLKLPLKPPQAIENEKDITWLTLNLTEQEILRKKEILLCYKSQIAYTKRFLFSFLRQNELFSQLQSIDLTQAAAKQPETFIQNISEPSSLNKKNFTHRQDLETLPPVVIYQKNEEYLEIKITSSEWKKKWRGTNIYIFTYNDHIPFAQMPKLRIYIGWGQRVSYFNRKERILLPDTNVSFQENSLTIQIPLKNLNDPTYGLVSVKFASKEHSLSTARWRVLQLKP